MGEIKKMASDDLTLVEVTGEIDLNAVIAVLQNIYSANPTKNILWDLNKASLKNIGSTEIKHITTFVSQNAHLREGGKTALVASSNLEFGIGRMLDINAEIKGLPFEVATFRNLSDAKQWLGIDELPVVD